MILDHKQGHLDSVRSFLSTALYPVQYVVNVPVELAGTVNDAISMHSSLLDENDRLREERLMLNSRLQRYEVLEAENHRLRNLFESSLKLKERVLIAELMAVDLEPFKHQIRINKGKKEGAYDGQPILDATGIMGQIIHVSPFYSDVLLITDPNHSIPVEINRNGLRAIAVGTGQKNVLQLEHLPSNADIKQGDLIVSSGLGHRFPAGYPVGTVRNITLDPAEPFAKIMVIPSARLQSSREVLLVWPHEKARLRYSNMKDFAFYNAR
jgi:rod shape-determining protein MreC